MKQVTIKKITRSKILSIMLVLSAFLICRPSANSADNPAVPEKPSGTDAAKIPLKVIYDNDFEKLPLGPFDAVKWIDGKPPFIIDNTWTGNPVSYAVVETEGIGGRSIEFDLNGFVQCDFGVPIKVEKGKMYRISGTIASQGPKQYTFILRRGPPPYTAYVSARGNANEIWRPFNFIVESSGDDDAHLMLSAGGESKLWLGSLKVEETDQKPEVKQPPILGNLIVNSSFELKNEGWHWRNNQFGQANVVPGKGTWTNNVSYSGLASFMLEGKAVVSSPFQPIASGHEYIFSAMVMGTHNGFVRTEITGPSDVGGGHYIKEPMKWQKIVFKYKFENQKGFFAFEETASPSLSVDLQENAKVWIDDVDFRVAPEAPYSPRFPKEFSVNTSDPRNVVVSGTPVKFEISCAAWRGEGNDSLELPDNIEAELFQFDEDGKLVKKWTGIELKPVTDNKDTSKSPQKDAFKIYKGSVDMESLGNGYWRFVVAESSDESGIGNLFGLLGSKDAPKITADLGEALVAVVPKLPDETPFSWQIGTHGKIDELFKCGVRWMRLHDASVKTKWHFLESEKGKWNWASADEEIDSYKKAGFRLLGLLDGCPGWRRPDKTASGSAMSYPDTDFKDWENYVFQTVSHFKGRIDAWEIMNEPIFAGRGPGERSNQQWYVELQKVAYKAAKKADPGCFVVGGGGAGGPNFNDGWFEEAIKFGLLENCDAVSYHGYGAANCRAAALGVGSLEAFVQWIQTESEKRTGKKIAIWDTEVGLTPPTSSRRYIWPQRDFGTIQSNIMGSLVCVLGEKSIGVEKTFIYHAFDIGLFEARCDLPNFTDINGQMTPISQTVGVAEWLTNDLVPDKHLQPTPKVNILVFKSASPEKKKKVWFIWAKGVNPLKITVKVPEDSKVRALNVFGRDIDFEKDGESVSVNVIPWPAYIVAE